MREVPGWKRSAERDHARRRRVDGAARYPRVREPLLPRLPVDPDAAEYGGRDLERRQTRGRGGRRARSRHALQQRAAQEARGITRCPGNCSHKKRCSPPMSASLGTAWRRAAQVRPASDGAPPHRGRASRGSRRNQRHERDVLIAAVEQPSQPSRSSNLHGARERRSPERHGCLPSPMPPKQARVNQSCVRRSEPGAGAGRFRPGASSSSCRTNRHARSVARPARHGRHGGSSNSRTSAASPPARRSHRRRCRPRCRHVPRAPPRFLARSARRLAR